MAPRPAGSAAGPPPAVFLSGKDPLLSQAGHGTYVRAHALALQQAGFAPHLFSVFPRTETVETSFGVLHRTACRVRPEWAWMLPFHGPLLARAVEAFVDQRGLRRVLIHAFGLWGGVADTTARRLRARGVKADVVVSAYGPYAGEVQDFLAGLDPRLGWWPRLRARAILRWSRLAVEPSEARGYREARIVAVNYEVVRRLLVRRYGLGGRCRRLPYTAELAFTARNRPRPPREPGPGRDADPPLIVSVSRHDGRKGVNVLLRALARLRDTGVPFRASLLGAGPLLDVDRRLAADLGFSPGGPVRIEGFVPDVVPFLRQADIYVLPSLHETSGSVALIEALQAGLPAVVSACDGLPEDVEDGRSALLVPPGDAEALAAALARLLAAPGLRRDLGAGARQAFLARFAPDLVVAAWRDLYAELGFPAPLAGQVLTGAGLGAPATVGSGATRAARAPRGGPEPGRDAATAPL